MLKEIKMLNPLKCIKDESVVEVAKKLRESNIRHIYVVDENDWPVGIISTTDMNNRVVAEGKNPAELKAKGIMSEPVEVFDINDDEVEVYRKLISNKRFDCAVAENKKFAGILTLNMIANHITRGN